MSDETQVYRAQLPFSPVPTDPNVGVPFGNANFVGRLRISIRSRCVGAFTRSSCQRWLSVVLLA